MMKNFGQGLFWGVVLGGLAGLMNAPRPGYETRRGLKQYLTMIEEDADDMRYKVDNVRTSFKRLTQEGMDAVEDMSQDLNIAIQRFNDEAEPRIKRIDERVNQLQDTIENIDLS